jgi:hypothetical protein
MSTINGFGTMRYDWLHREDGTSEATTWLVMAFLPIVPLRREKVVVVSEGVERTRAVDVAAAALGAAGGFGSGFASRIAVLERTPMRWGGVLRTYLYGFVAVPLLAFAVPLAIAAGGMKLIDVFGFKDTTAGDLAAISLLVFGIGWMAVCIAKILDRAAGRQNARGVLAGPPDLGSRE